MKFDNEKYKRMWRRKCQYLQARVGSWCCSRSEETPTAASGVPRAFGHRGERHWRGPSPQPHSVGGAGVNMMNRHVVER